ncbi:PPOX class F420-dependent oxidoreductase [Pseudonocardia eucalypti]|uniref:PPOX class F420-dependent oxidoreductase n=1 Tax=Pseudonocardia eucalypti TaxID=648755 RepID=A0ABP9PLW7_9PSEU|nr:PPOX class probable F420-dependent enzyme [Pseudonocardia eucalypti]
MANQRAKAVLSTEELHQLLDEPRTVMLATIGPDGLPHLAAMWALRDGDNVLMWTYGSSQKAENVRRDPRATLMVEAGTAYNELRGASLDCSVEIVDDLERKQLAGARIGAKYLGISPDAVSPDQIPEQVRKQAAKRVLLVFKPTRIRSWDHGKL